MDHYFEIYEYILDNNKEKGRSVKYVLDAGIHCIENRRILTIFGGQRPKTFGNGCRYPN